ncbi:pilus assembly PilX N-terminal domain-containing protein [Patescibacteria group bacterium]|nr:pilus assembly PilX N-terminal domain-containing protein [Patescibacteria group bacterium]MBU2158569.1 pilus assembly PilX N-terminal domain-containing protein [Patescibacteria group bacterium]MBU2220705.1 pilus assembly PilX N-terminal domain-containing protein [Patescibacteria group bacterium]
MSTPYPRGFTLLIAVILTSVLLSVGLALLDVAYKQVVLSSTAKQSQTAFYAADSALECALYWDQKQGAFAYGSASASVSCTGQTFPVTTSISSNIQKSVFYVACPSGESAQVEVYKANGGATCSSGKTTCIYANGYNTCDASNPRRIERGLKVVY